MIQELTTSTDTRFGRVIDVVASVLDSVSPTADLELVVIDETGAVALHLRAGKSVDGLPLSTTYGSAFKPFAALAMMEIADDLGLDVDVPLVEAGVRLADEGTTMRHVLDHRAGLPQIRDLAPEARDLADEDRIITELRSLDPLWASGTHTAYHAVSYGYLLQAVCEDLTGRSLVEEIQQRVLDRVGIGEDDIRLDSQASVDAPSRRPTFVVGSPKIKWKGDGKALYHRSCYRLDDLVGFLNALPTNAGAPLSCGIAGTAMGLAQFYSAVLATGSNPPFGELTRNVLASAQDSAVDRLLYQRVAWRGGFLEGAGLPPGRRSESVIGMSGFGGPIGFCDERSGVACGMVTTQVDASVVLGHAARAVAEEVLDAVGR